MSLSQEENVDAIYDVLIQACEKITGIVFENRKPVHRYIDEIHNYFLSITNQIPCYLYWKNSRFEYIGCNKMVVDFFNFALTKDIIGKTDFDLFADKSLANIYRKVDEEILSSGRAIFNHEEVLVNAAGVKFDTLVSKVPIFGKNGNVIGILGITVDITDRKKMEEELRVAKEAAEAANHAKTEFIANMGHDIRTPLTGIIGMSTILEEEVQNPEEKAHATMIHQSGDQLLGLLNGVLDLITVDATNEDMVQHEAFDVRQVMYHPRKSSCYLLRRHTALNLKAFF